jgi:hypothetical protein
MKELLLHADDPRVNLAPARSKPQCSFAARAKALVRLEINRIQGKKQGATGITTAAPYIAGQWGRGDNRLP